jgi:phage-related protein
MDDKWKIELYKSANNKSPIDEFVDSLEVKVQNKIIEAFSLLKEFGVALGMPYSKKLTGTSLWELRILGSDNIRIFYIAKTGKTFLLLHGFKKKKQKTDKKEIKIAVDRLLDYNSRTKN